MLAYRDLIRPEIINSIEGLELVSKVVVDNFFHGLTRSRRVGTGQEFSQYRSYEPGDDLRLLDWKMLARSSRYYIRQAEVDTSVVVKFIIDATKSMEHTEAGVSKIDFARLIAASIGYLAQNQGDNIGLHAVGELDTVAVLPKMDKQHFSRFLFGLTQIRCSGKWPEFRKVEKQLHGRRKEKELLLFVTDFHEHDSELFHFIGKQKTPRNEVVVIQLVGERELKLNYRNMVSLQDLETGEIIRLNPDEVKSGHILAVQNKYDELKRVLLDKQVEYHLLRLDDPLEDSLAAFLKTRNRLVK
ncbi:MAG: DUF58 domain-containing protein [Bacteroidota bacterium]